MKRPRRFYGHGLECRITVMVSETDGRIISRRTFPSRSYLIGFMQILACQMGQSGVLTALDTGNVSRTLATNAGNLGTQASGNARGIVVGTGTTAVTASDIALQTIIASGSGAGQLTYGAETQGTPAVSGANSVWTLQRIFTNNSAGSITVKEIGMYMVATITPYTFCSARDIVPAGGVAVATTKTLTIIYTFTMPS